jgi:hypothetical protein
MIETGLYAITNCGVPRHYAVDVKPNYVSIAVFEFANPGTATGMGGVMLWADLLAYLEARPVFGNQAGFVDLAHNERFVPDLPGAPMGAIYKGRSCLFATGMRGQDELVPYALIDLAVGADGRPLTWRNRFAQSAREKIDTSFRHRARAGISNALVMFMPIVVPFDAARIEVLCEIEPILLNGTLLEGVIDDATIPKDGVWYKQFYFHAVGPEMVAIPADGRVEVPVALKWNADSSAFAHSLVLKLETDAGYLPKRRLMTTTDGTGSFAVEALGLNPGDRITVKLNTEHYTAIGKIVLEVI